MGTALNMITADPDIIAAIGPRVRKSPYYSSTVEAGLSAVSSYNHMWLPMSYGDLDAEYRRLTTGVSMWDVAAQRHLEISGPDCDSFVQRVTTADVSSVPRGHGIYSPIVDHEGTLINDPVIFHWIDGTWRLSISDSDLRLWLSPLAHGLGADVSIRELETATLAVQGPSSYEVLRSLGVDWLEGADHLVLRESEVPAGGGAISLVVGHSGWSTQGGAELFLDDPGRALDLWDTIASAGAAWEIGPGAPNATERIENVLLSYGTDTGYGANPLELGLDDHVDFDAGDFIGRDALSRVQDDGPRRRLLGVVIDGPAIGTVPSPIPLAVEGRTVGALRAGVHSPRFGRNIGLALVDAAVNPGATGSVERNGDQRDIRLVRLPFDDVLDE